MKEYYVIDGTNGNKVVSTSFWSKDEAKKWIKDREFEVDWKNNYESFENFIDEYSIISSKKMKKAVKEFGSRKLEYWT